MFDIKETAMYKFMHDELQEVLSGTGRKLTEEEQHDIVVRVIDDDYLTADINSAFDRSMKEVTGEGIL